MFENYSNKAKLKPKGKYSGDDKYIYFGTKKISRGDLKKFYRFICTNKLQ